jgi:hypothetical protein
MPVRPQFLHRPWFEKMMARLSGLDDEAKTRLQVHWSCKLDDGAKRTLYRYMDSLHGKVCFKALLYIAERYTCWFFNESSSRWEVVNPSAALVWILRWTFWYDHSFDLAFLGVDF